MSHKFVVVSKDTCSIQARYVHKKRCETWIKKELEKVKSEWGRGFGTEYEILSVEEYDDRWHEDVEVINLLSGLPATIKRGQKGTVSDPSLEIYYSF